VAQLRGKSTEPAARIGAPRAGRAETSDGSGTGDRGAGRSEDVPGAVVRWGAVATVVRALAATAAPVSSSWRALERLTIGLTEPLRRLDQLALDVGRAVSGDDHAAHRVRATIAEVATLSRRVDLGPVLGAHASVGGELGGELVGEPGAGPAETAAGARPHVASAPSTLLDETELTTLLLGVARVAGPDDRDTAVDAVAVLVLAAGALGSLVVAHDEGGAVGLVACLESLIATGALGWAAPRAVPTVLPAHEPRGAACGLPRDVPRDVLSDLPSDPLDDLLAQLRTRPHWDPDLLDHVYPWWDPPVEAIDPRWWDEVRGFLEVRRRLTEHAEPAPVRPQDALWSDGITGVELADVSAGSTITLIGTGFGARQPAGVALLLPTARGCRPTTPLSWSDTRITAVLPPEVASGSVGFADAGYVAGYDAWAARRNAVDAALASLPCVRSVPVLTEPFHESVPPTTATRLHAGTPAVAAFSANGTSVLALEPGIPLRLRWTVRNVETLTVERTSATGPLLDGATTLVDPVATSIALGVPSYSTLQVWTYRLTVTGAAGPQVSSTVTVVAGKRPALRIESIEVTQSVRPVPEPAGLVESKPTVVRVAVRHGLAGFGNDLVADVRGRIRVHGPEIGVSPWFDAANGSGALMAPNPGTSITVRAASMRSVPVRGTTNDTLDFLVPPGWARGAATRFDVEVRVDGFGAAGGFAGYRERVARSVGPFGFETRSALQLRFIRVAWDGGAAPSAEECTSTLAGVVPLLPAPTAGIAAVPGVGVQTVTVATGSNGSEERRALIDDWAERRDCTAFEPLAEWLGYERPEDDGAIWVLIPGRFVCGEAYDVPSSVCLTPPNDSPYAAHELAHCLARRRTDPTGASTEACASTSATARDRDLRSR